MNMKRGFQRAGKQPTKRDIDIGVVTNCLRHKEREKAIEYSHANGIDDEVFKSIEQRIENVNSKKDYFAIVVTYQDDSKSICKGRRAIPYSEKVTATDRSMLYTSYALALKGKNAFDANKSSIDKSFDIEPIIIE